MLTPQEVSEHAFSKASFGGYNMTMVDEFLDLLTEDYTTLYKENAALKAKMKVLVDKVEEYRTTEDAMRKALLTAQRMADELVAEAETKKAKLLQDAETEARARMDQLAKEVRAEEQRLSAAKREAASYVAKLKELYQHEMDYLNNLSSFTPPPESEPAPEGAGNKKPADDPVSSTARDIEASIEASIAADQPAPAAVTPPAPAPVPTPAPIPVPEPAPAPAEVSAGARTGRLGWTSPLKRISRQEDPSPGADPDDTSPTRRIDFDNLQFGKDYEIR